MWQMALRGMLGRFGDLMERRVAPPFYAHETIVTLSASSKAEIVARLRLDPEQVVVAPPGIGPQFQPGGERAARPLVVAVGRLVPVKRFDLLIQEVELARRQIPDLELVIVGEGYERAHLEAQIRSLDATSWISMPGFVAEEELVGWYQRAWCVASTSLREGWGMTLTEAAACGTPAVASAIAGHADAVEDGTSGLLVEDVATLGGELARVLRDADLRARLGAAALDRATTFSWDATALTALSALASSRRAR
jgi:glycosyltransferase involved in cell wall biosynthesis